MEFIRGLAKKPLDAVLYLLAAIIIVKLASLYFQVNPDDSQWNQFKLDHQCHHKLTVAAPNVQAGFVMMAKLTIAGGNNVNQ